VNFKPFSSDRRFVAFFQTLHGGSEKSQLWVVVSGSEKAGCDEWRLECQASNVAASVLSDHILH